MIGSDRRRRARTARASSPCAGAAARSASSAVRCPYRQPTIRTDEDTIDTASRLAVHSRRVRSPASSTVKAAARRPASASPPRSWCSLRRYRDIPRHQPPADPSGRRAGHRRPAAAEILGVAPSTLPPLARRRLHRRRTAHPRRALAASASPTSCAAASSNTRPRLAADADATKPSASRARPCCSVSSAANWPPSSPAGRRKGLRIQRDPPPNQPLFETTIMNAGQCERCLQERRGCPRRAPSSPSC